MFEKEACTWPARQLLINSKKWRKLEECDFFTRNDFSINCAKLSQEIQSLQELSFKIYSACNKASTGKLSARMLARKNSVKILEVLKIFMSSFDESCVRETCCELS